MIKSKAKFFEVPFSLVMINCISRCIKLIINWVLFRAINEFQFISTTNLRHVVRITSIFYTLLLHVYAQKESIGLYFMSLTGMILRLGQEF